MEKTRSFFTTHVIPTFEEWKKSKTDIRLAMTLASNLNNLVDYLWVETGEKLAPDISVKTLLDYRNAIGKQNRNIALIRDIADAHKHLKIHRQSKHLTSPEQMHQQNIGLGQCLGLRCGGGDILAVELDSGDLEYFDIIVESVINHWRQLLSL